MGSKDNQEWKAKLPKVPMKELEPDEGEICKLAQHTREMYNRLFNNKQKPKKKKKGKNTRDTQAAP
jgi:hypothetical protein